jgi:hypothetical protein
MKNINEMVTTVEDGIYEDGIYEDGIFYFKCDCGDGELVCFYVIQFMRILWIDEKITAEIFLAKSL